MWQAACAIAVTAEMALWPTIIGRFMKGRQTNEPSLLKATRHCSPFAKLFEAIGSHGNFRHLYFSDYPHL